MSDPVFSDAFNEAALTGRRDFLDAGGDAAEIRIYNGTRPAAGGTPTTLLATIVLTNPCGDIDDGSLSLTQDAEYDLAVATGTATWGRLVTAAGQWCIDADVGNEASAAPIKIDSTGLIAGGKVSLISAVLTG
jgi:hypothetical protein